MANIPRGGGGMGGLGGLNNPNMLKQLGDLQRKMIEGGNKLEELLTSSRLEGSSGGGAVKATVNGHGKVVEVVIAKDVVDPEDVEMLQDLIATALREAQEQAETLRREEQEKLMPASIPGLNMSGLF